ncbi:Probable RNA methyltransferase Y17G7B.18 [Geodia barretti]|nr:Probable RNA methyltransferase Y17G7B.18 [Geodia barretti]
MYYGYRCSGRGSAEVSDPRLGHMKREWFEGKDCLDIGCNTGQITLAIARHFNPQSIVGIDIDHKLVRIANKNLFRQQIPAVTPDGRAFPSSFTSMAPFSLLSSKIRSSRAASRVTSTPQPFPNNISFSQENYVPQSEPDVEAVDQQYDVILALSLTKWIHLNWGDAGLRRTFRKMFRQLRPGGRLLLEPQSFASYTKKKKLTPAIYQNYHTIEFQPSQFQAYLMSGEVGFTKHRFLGVPQHKAEGFRRPLHLYMKSKTSDYGSRGGGESSGKVGDQESVGGWRRRGRKE